MLQLIDDDAAEGNKWVTPLTTPRGELSPGQRFAPEDRLDDVVRTGSSNDHATHFLEGLSNERATEVCSVAVECVRELAQRGHREYISQISNTVSMMESDLAQSEC